MTRKNTEGKHCIQSRMRKRRILKEAKYFYREDAKTAKRQKGRSKKHFRHGISRNQKSHISFRAGCVSDGSFLRRRTQLFIAYLYKPEAQAKVLQIPVYYSHIIPSLVLQACKARDTVKSRFPHPQLILDKGARALRQAQGPGLFRYGQ